MNDRTHSHDAGGREAPNEGGPAFGFRCYHELCLCLCQSTTFVCQLGVCEGLSGWVVVIKLPITSASGDCGVGRRQVVKNGDELSCSCARGKR